MSARVRAAVPPFDGNGPLSTARSAGRALPQLDAAAAVSLDDEVLEAATRQTDGSAVARLALDGLHCAACAGIIESIARGMPGVIDATCNAASRRLVLHWTGQPRVVPLVVDGLRRAGYGAQPEHAPAEATRLRVESRRALWRLLVAGFCMMQVMMFTTPAYFARPGEIAPDLDALMRWGAWVLTLPVLAFSAGPFFSGAWNALKARRVGMDVPVALGIAITFVAGTGATFDAGGVFGHEAYLDSLTMFVTFLLGGRWLEARARARSLEAVDALLHRLPDAVQRLDEHGVATWVPVSKLQAGDRVRVALGQAMPGDGVVLEGRTQVDEALLTGESLPLPRGAGERVIAGSLNVGAPVVVRLDAVGRGTRYREIVDLVQQALAERPAALMQADRWAGPFVLGVLLLAAGAAAVWSVVDPSRAVWVAVSVLIVTCPCALSLATPAALLAATGALAKRGVLVRRLDAIEALASVDVACFDKTGTLTQDRLELACVEVSAGADREWLHVMAASLAAHSQHPVSRALVASAPSSAGEGLGWGPAAWKDIHEQPGHGLEARDASGAVWRLGAPDWARVPRVDEAGPSRVRVVLVRQRAEVEPGLRQAQSDRAAEVCEGLRQAQAERGEGERAWAKFEFDESLRPDAPEAVAELARQGVSVRMLSGDAPAHVQSVADRLHLSHAAGGQSPEAKWSAVRAWQSEGRRVLMVGDGLNDGPVLAAADVSIALSHGSALTQQKADFVVMGSRLAEVAFARNLATRAVRVVRQNLAWSAVYNMSCIPLALLGWLPPWAAGLGMAVSSLGVVLNALRLLR